MYFLIACWFFTKPKTLDWYNLFVIDSLYFLFAHHIQPKMLNC